LGYLGDVRECQVRLLLLGDQIMATKIPIFVSAPTALSSEQQISYEKIIRLFDRENLERRALGRSDYPTEFPLTEVYLIARHCSGYSQSIAETMIVKPNTPHERKAQNVKSPTPWNQLEAGILFSLRVPLMVFREDGVTGGVFDEGVTDVYVNKLPVGAIEKATEKQMIAAIQSWVGRVREHYRTWS
jgi:hypothetical protein